VSGDPIRASGDPIRASGDPIGAIPDPIRAIADAVLYEGYILWPYRRSAMKNQQRWTFGGVYPPAHSAGHPDDACETQTQCVIEAGPEARISVTVRFLQIVQRAAMRATGHGLAPVEELIVDGERHLSWEEAREHEIELRPCRLGELALGCVQELDIPSGSEREDLRTAAGDVAGALQRSWVRIVGRIETSAEALSEQAWMVSVRIVNETPSQGESRAQALQRTMCSTHALLRSDVGGLISLAEPPSALAQAAAACENRGTWPVLVGEPGERHTVLSSPIILDDYPRVAPESPGDLFDGGEIDQLLVLNILTLTDEEKQEMRASDPRAKEILDRTESLSPDDLMRLHGTIREFGLARER